MPLILYETPTVIESPLIIIEADKIKSRLNKTTSNLKIFQKEEISKYQRLDEILATQSDIEIAHSGARGSNASLFLRGTDSAHTLVIIDGIVMNDPSNPNRQFDIGRLSLNGVEKIEILKGSQGLLYGSNAIGGVILITTLNKKEASLHLSAGSYDTLNSGFVYSNFFKKTHYSLGLNHFKSTGFSAANDPSRKNDNDHSQALTLHTKLSHQFSERFSGDLVFRNQKDQTDIDKMSAVDDPNDFQKNNEMYLKSQLNYEGEKYSGHYSFKETTHKRELNVLSDSYDSANYQYSTYGKNQTFSLENEFYINSNYSQKFDLSVMNESMNVDKGEKYKNVTYSSLFFNRITLNQDILDFGIRLDYNENFKEYITYRASYLKNFDQIDLRLNLSTGYKSPGLNQLFDPNYGNKNLKPEKSMTAEVGVEFSSLKDQKINISFYTTHIKDRHSYDPLTYVNLNDGKTRIDGVELNYKYFISQDLSFNSSYHYLNTIDVEKKESLIRRPKNAFNAEIEYRLNQHSFLFNTHFVGKRQDIDKNAMKVKNPNYQTWNVAYRLKVNDQINAGLKLNNLFNTKYEEVVGYNSNGRNFEISLNYIF